jgi:hypothetical protein
MFYALPVGTGASFVFGLWTEAWQGSVSGRFSSIDDLTLDTLGILCGGLALSIRDYELGGEKPAGRGQGRTTRCSTKVGAS